MLQLYMSQQQAAAAVAAAAAAFFAAAQVEMLGRCLPVQLCTHKIRHLQGLLKRRVQPLRQRHIPKCLHTM
jgi:hypothetical protein